MQGERQMMKRESGRCRGKKRFISSVFACVYAYGRASNFGCICAWMQLWLGCLNCQTKAECSAFVRNHFETIFNTELHISIINAPNKNSNKTSNIYEYKAEKQQLTMLHISNAEYIINIAPIQAQPNERTNDWHTNKYCRWSSSISLLGEKKRDRHNASDIHTERESECWE